MFVRFSCGCIGIHTPDALPLVIHPCDLSGDACWEPLRITTRPDLVDKDTTPLSTERVAELVSALDGLLVDGYKLRRVKAALS